MSYMLDIVVELQVIILETIKFESFSMLGGVLKVYTIQSVSDSTYIIAMYI